MVIDVNVATMQGEAEGLCLPDVRATYRFLTARLNEGKRYALVVRVPHDCSAEEFVGFMNDAWAIVALCTKAKWPISFGLA